MDFTTLGYTLAATTYTFAMTALGAASILFFKRSPSHLFIRLSLGFAAGIMIAAAIWSLLDPAMEQAERLGWAPALPCAGGFLLGAGFLILLDNITPHLHMGSKTPEGPETTLPKKSLLFFAVTLHNIPEGMAVGISFASAISLGSPEALSIAIALAVGMGIQNVPEGAAVTLPLRSNGASRLKAFAMGALSGLVEPIAAVLVVFLTSFFIPLMPWLLSFAAGAMIYVVVEELIPEANQGPHSDLATVAVIAGFTLMMVLDTTLG